MLVKYLYETQELEFDIEFNESDLIMQVDINDCLYNDVFSVIDLKQQNSFFDDMGVIKEIMLKCFEEEDKCSVKIKQGKSLTMLFSINIGLKKNLEMVLELLPIRKDISNSTEIIALKRKIKMLDQCISPRFLFHEYFLYPLNLNYNDIICFSPILGNTLKLSFVVNTELHDIFSQASVKIGYTNKNTGTQINGVFINDTYGFTINNVFFSNNNFTSVLNLTTTKPMEFLTEELKRGASKKFAFYDVHLPDNLGKYLPLNMTTIYFVNVKVASDFNTYLKKLLDQFSELTSITICQTVTPIKINSINCLKDTSRSLTINLCGKKPTIYEGETFPTNVRIKP